MKKIIGITAAVLAAFALAACSSHPVAVHTSPYTPPEINGATSALGAANSIPNCRETFVGHSDPNPAISVQAQQLTDAWATCTYGESGPELILWQFPWQSTGNRQEFMNHSGTTFATWSDNVLVESSPHGNIVPENLALIPTIQEELDD